jgi:hypothetical protein
MKNRISVFIAIIVSCAILYTSTIINGNIISAQQPNKNNSTGVTSAAANTTKEAKAAENKTGGEAQSSAANTTQAAKSAENKLEHAAKTFMNNTGHAAKQFIINLTGTTKQFLVGGK